VLSHKKTANQLRLAEQHENLRPISIGNIAMIKRKGQIVPKNLVKAVEKKSQHLVKFGCDVSITGKTITALNGGTVIVVPEARYCNLKKNKRTVKGFNFEGLTFVGFDLCIHVSGQKNILVNEVSFYVS